MLFGLGLGLVVALLVYLGGSRIGPDLAGQRPAPRAAAVPPAPVGTAPATPPATAEPLSASEATEPPATEPAEERFSFYELLPQFEVVVPEIESSAGSDRNAAAIEQPGVYVLQVGSFHALADADRMQARLALLGIESQIQRVMIDDDVWHRVRIGPIRELGELNRVRRQLRDERIESLVMELHE
jgi:cell division protein FtsN